MHDRTQAAAEAGDEWDARPFVDWLRDRMRHREWTQADLARALDVPRGQVSSWLNGQKQPRPQSALAIADVFAADPDLLLSLTGNRPPTPVGDDAVTEIVSLLRRVDLIRDDRLETVRGMLERWYARDRRAPRRRTQNPVSAD